MRKFFLSHPVREYLRLSRKRYIVGHEKNGGRKIAAVYDDGMLRIWDYESATSETPRTLVRN